MNRMPAFLDQAAFVDMLDGRGNRASVVVAERGWNVVIRSGAGQAMLTSQRGKPRLFASTDSAISFLQRLGVSEILVDVRDLDPLRKRTRAARPDRAAALKQAHEAAEYDRWFREQVQIGIESADRGESEEASVVFARVRKRLVDKLARLNKERSS